MEHSFPLSLSYDDVLLEPSYSEVLPADTDTSTRLAGPLHLSIPILSAAMDTVTEADMAIALGDLGGAGVIHRNMNPTEQAEHVARAKYDERIVGAAVAPTDFSRRLPMLVDHGVDFVVIDTAHGDSRNVIDTISAIKHDYALPTIGGNVATAAATRRLIDAGADAVKVGVGPGSICTTRIVAGIGVPQFSAVLACAEEAARSSIPVIADGGIRYSGDIVKALAAGASSVMLGNLLAGMRETPGRVFEQNGRLFKLYRGMGSEASLKRGGADRYQGKSNDLPVPEGVEGAVPVKGGLHEFIYQLVEGLRKGMGYCGCRTVSDLQAYKRFVRITASGMRESHVHTLEGVKNTVNYHGIFEYTG